MGKDARIRELRKIARLLDDQQRASSSCTPSWVKYFRQIGAASTFIGAAMAIASIYFWAAATIFIFGLACLAVDIWFEQWKMRWRLFGWACLSLPGLFVLWLCFLAEAPMDIRFIRHSGNYDEGKMIHGIEWKVSYSEVQGVFHNKSEQAYDDLDILIQTDLMVAQYKLIDPPPNCSIRRDEHPVSVVDVRAQGKDEKGNIVHEQILTPFAFSGPHRVHCDHLFPHDKVQVFFALAPRKMPDAILGPKKLSEWVSINGSYKMIYRPYWVSKRWDLSGE